MSTQPLYLQYRSRDFDTIVGQKHISTILRDQVMTKNVFHTYIFYGPRGVGKTSMARVLAKAMNCSAPVDGNPCGECANCRLLAGGATTDLIEIDAASYTGVDNIRETIIDKIAYPPTQLDKKVYIIDEAHMLSKSAYNALLKIMEEPPEHVVFILATTEIDKIPATIISRSQLYNFRVHTMADIVDHLRYIAAHEQITITDEALDAIARIADGGMRDAIKYLDHIRMVGDVTMEKITSMLGIVAHTVLDDMTQAIVTKDRDRAGTLIEHVQAIHIDWSRFIRDMQQYVGDLFREQPAVYSDIVGLLIEVADSMRYSTFPDLVYTHHIYIYCVPQQTSLHEKRAEKTTIPPIEPERPDIVERPDDNQILDETPQGILQRLQQQDFGKTTNTALIKSTTPREKESTQDSYVYAVVNPIHHKQLSKPDTAQRITDAVHKQYTNDIQIVFRHVDKEAFLSQ